MRREILIVRPAADDDERSSLDAEHAPMGVQEEVESALRGMFGDGTAHGAGQWLFDGPGFSLLASLGVFPIVDSVTLEVWGDADPEPYIRELCLPRGWEAFDLDSGQTITELGGR
jgi:hypothetical protein